MTVPVYVFEEYWLSVMVGLVEKYFEYIPGYFVQKVKKSDNFRREYLVLFRQMVKRYSQELRQETTESVKKKYFAVLEQELVYFEYFEKKE